MSNKLQQAHNHQLQSAAINNDTDTMLRLLRPNPYRADIDTIDVMGWTPLMLAAHHAANGSLRVLTSYKADVDHASPRGDTALGIAAASIEDPARDADYIEAVSILLTAGANVAPLSRLRLSEAARTAVNQALQILKRPPLPEPGQDADHGPAPGPA